MLNNQVVQFDDGSITMHLHSEDGPVIQWYPNDSNFIDRLSRFNVWLEDFRTRLAAVRGLGGVELDEKGAPVNQNEEYQTGTIEQFGEELKGKLDEVFNAPVSAAAFSTINPVSPTLSGGLVFENFLEAVIPLVEQSFEGFQEAREKYTERFRNRAQRRAKE